LSSGSGGSGTGLGRFPIRHDVDRRRKEKRDGTTASPEETTMKHAAELLRGSAIAMPAGREL